MYWFIGVGVKNSIDIMVEATAVNTIEFTCLERCHSRAEMYSLIGIVFISPIKDFVKIHRDFHETCLVWTTGQFVVDCIRLHGL